jgi:hypothetical protein
MASPATSDFYGAVSKSVKLSSMNHNEQLSRKAIDDFKTIYFEEFHEKLTDAQAQEMAVRLLAICKTLAAGLSAPARETVDYPV